MAKTPKIQKIFRQENEHSKHLVSFTGTKAAGIQINVCTNGEPCFDCGTTSVTDPGVWIEFQCPAGTEGNTVQVKNELYHLQICEIIVYGKCEYARLG